MSDGSLEDGSVMADWGAADGIQRAQNLTKDNCKQITLVPGGESIVSARVVSLGCNRTQDLPTNMLTHRSSPSNSLDVVDTLKLISVGALYNMSRYSLSLNI